MQSNGTPIEDRSRMSHLRHTCGPEADGQLNMTAVRSELQTLACARALIRNQPLRPPCRRLIAALDIESSASRRTRSRPNSGLCSMSSSTPRCAQRESARATATGSSPVFSHLLASYNASLPHPGSRDRQLRVRVVMHAGNVHNDDNGAATSYVVRYANAGSGSGKLAICGLISGPSCIGGTWRGSLSVFPERFAGRAEPCRPWSGWGCRRVRRAGFRS